MIPHGGGGRRERQEHFANQPQGTTPEQHVKISALAKAVRPERVYRPWRPRRYCSVRGFRARRALAIAMPRLTTRTPNLRRVAVVHCGFGVLRSRRPLLPLLSWRTLREPCPVVMGRSSDEMSRAREVAEWDAEGCDGHAVSLTIPRSLPIGSELLGLGGFFFRRGFAAEKIRDGDRDAVQAAQGDRE